MWDLILKTLTRINIRSTEILSVYLDESFLICIFKNQILSLIIDIDECEQPDLIKDINTFIFTQIFTMFSNIQYLKFDSSFGYHRLSFDFSPPIVFSSTLLELHVIVDSCKECLYLLDGRFNQLHTFRVTICSLIPTLPTINNEVSYS